MPNPSSTATTPAMLASAELFLSQQQDNTPENAAKPVCDTGQEWMQHFDADPRSEPVTGVKGSNTPLAPQATRNLQSHIVAQSGSEMELHASPDSNPPDQSSMAQNTNSAQFVHLRNSGETSFPTSSHKSYPSPNRAPTKNSKFDSQQPSVHGVLPRTASMKPMSPPVTSVVSAEGRSEVRSLVDPHINVFGDRESQDTSQSVTEQSVVNSHEQQLYFHRRQPTTTDRNSSINEPFQVQPTVVGLPPSKVPPMIETSAEASDSAATLVESVYEVDTTATPASAYPIEQRLAVTSGGSSPDLSALQEVQPQDPGYLGSNKFASSSILHQHAGDMDPRGRIPMDSSQTEHDSEGIQIYMVT